jgi:hypothetical protein
MRVACLNACLSGVKHRIVFNGKGYCFPSVTRFSFQEVTSSFVATIIVDDLTLFLLQLLCVFEDRNYLLTWGITVNPARQLRHVINISVVVVIIIIIIIIVRVTD